MPILVLFHIIFSVKDYTFVFIKSKFRDLEGLHQKLIKNKWAIAFNEACINKNMYENTKIIGIIIKVLILYDIGESFI